MRLAVRAHGMRYRDAQLQEGDELREGGHVYTVARVEQAASPTALGKAWVELVET